MMEKEKSSDKIKDTENLSTAGGADVDSKEKDKEKEKEKGPSTSKSQQQGVSSQSNDNNEQQQQQQKLQQHQSQQQQPQKKRKNATGPPGKLNQQPLKRRRKREEGAPKLPLTGYVRYMNFRRDSIRKEFPDKTSVEHTKMIADEWNRMSEELKKPYLQAAEVDKERYNKQMMEFNKQKKAEIKSFSSSNENGQQNNIKASSNSSVSPNNSTSGISSGTTTIGISNTTSAIITQIQNCRGVGGDIANNSNHSSKFGRRPGGESSIQIFTDEFLEHNKTVDLELRTLRKSNIDYEQQNSVLEKHIENMKFGVEKMQTENSELMEKNVLLETYLQKLKTKLAQALSGLAIPTQPNGATIENIDKYMADLHSMASSNSHGPASLNKAKDIIRKLDLQIQL